MSWYDAALIGTVAVGGWLALQRPRWLQVAITKHRPLISLGVAALVAGGAWLWYGSGHELLGAYLVGVGAMVLILMYAVSLESGGPPDDRGRPWGADGPWPS